jgi:hypothetical protein
MIRSISFSMKSSAQTAFQSILISQIQRPTRPHDGDREDAVQDHDRNGH